MSIINEQYRQAGSLIPKKLIQKQLQNKQSLSKLESKRVSTDDTRLPEDHNNSNVNTPGPG